MFKRLRITILLYVLLFVAASQLVTSLATTDWDEPLWVDVYAVNGDRSDAVGAYIEALDEVEFAAIEDFFASEARRFGIALDKPMRLFLGHELDQPLPEMPATSSMLDAMVWSLKMRWLTAKLNWQSDRPTPDIVLYAVFHGDGEAVLERSGALRKGLIAVANVFADRRARGANHVVMAHELLHTLGATDKYDAASTLPLFPHGYAEPDATPLHPQRYAEIMAGRIALDTHEARIPDSLRQVLVGRATAMEIRWLHAD